MGGHTKSAGQINSDGKGCAHPVPTLYYAGRTGDSTGRATRYYGHGGAWPTRQRQSEEGGIAVVMTSYFTEEASPRQMVRWIGGMARLGAFFEKGKKNIEGRGKKEGGRVSGSD